MDSYKNAVKDKNVCPRLTLGKKKTQDGETAHQKSSPSKSAADMISLGSTAAITNSTYRQHETKYDPGNIYQPECNSH